MDVKDIIFHHEINPDENPRVHGAPSMAAVIEVVPYDPAWPEMYEKIFKVAGYL